MTSPLEFDKLRPSQPSAPSISRGLSGVKNEDTLRDFIVVLFIASAFGGALFFVLSHSKKTLLLAARRERWKDWRPLR